jgi:glutamine amidotransferase
MHEVSPEVVLIDYGMGNLFSLERVIRHLGGTPHITSDPAKIAAAERLILPGVGAFGEGMVNLREKGLIEPIRVCARSGRRVLGICLGMQLLMTESFEFGHHLGLDIVAGQVVRLPDPQPEGPCYKIPHVGWNGILVPQREVDTGRSAFEEDSILRGISSGSFVYFVHSFEVVPRAKRHILAETDYAGKRFCSALRDGNVFGCQFHPEISGDAGLRIIKEFLSTCRHLKEAIEHAIP